MRTTTYKCDRCGVEDKDNKMSLAEVIVEVRSSQSYGSAYSDGKLKKEWCADCRVITGLELPRIREQETPEKVVPITLEDLVRELVREEIENVS